MVGEETVKGMGVGTGEREKRQGETKQASEGVKEGWRKEREGVGRQVRRCGVKKATGEKQTRTIKYEHRQNRHRAHEAVEDVP